MNQTKKLLRAWEDATIDLCNHFTLKYFDKDADVYFVADEIGKVLAINDYFFDLDEILDFLKYNYSKKMMFAWYDYKIECSVTGKLPINIKNYKKCKNTLK